jgi:hypothetical protein
MAASSAIMELEVLKEPQKNEPDQTCLISGNGSSSRLALNFPGTTPGNQAAYFNSLYFSMDMGHNRR